MNVLLFKPSWLFVFFLYSFELQPSMYFLETWAVIHSCQKQMAEKMKATAVKDKATWVHQADEKKPVKLLPVISRANTSRLSKQELGISQ